MLTESRAKSVELAVRPAPWAGLGRLRPSLWHVVVAASYVAGVGSGWRVLMTKATPASPLTVAVVMMLVTLHLNRQLLFR